MKKMRLISFLLALTLMVTFIAPMRMSVAEDVDQPEAVETTPAAEVPAEEPAPSTPAVEATEPEVTEPEVTEPEASEELLNAITDYRIETLPYIKKYFNPDFVTILDDVATGINLFMPPAVYQDLIAPQHKRWFDAVRDLDMIPSIHICGHCETIVPGLVDEGADMWEICEPMNDLPALAEQVGDKLAFFGGISMQSELALKVPTEEELKQEARNCIDKYGPCGNYGFMGMLMFEDMNEFFRAFTVMNGEAIAYGTNYYV